MINSYFQRERVFIFKTNGSVLECNSLTDAIKMNDKNFIIIDKFKDIFIPSGGYEHRFSDFVFLNDNGETIDLKNNSWTVHSIDYIYKSTSEITFVIKISDPFKSVRNIRMTTKRETNYSHPDSHDMNIVLLTLEKLNELSKFHNWEQIDLDLENETIKEENEKLKKIISGLNEQLNSKK